MAVLKRIGRALSLITLAAFAAAFAALYLLEATSACVEIGTAQVNCGNRLISFVANASQGILLAGIFTVVPMFFAIAGALFLLEMLIDFVRRKLR